MAAPLQVHGAGGGGRNSPHAAHAPDAAFGLQRRLALRLLRTNV
jgi:hypothetical protein